MCATIDPAKLAELLKARAQAPGQLGLFGGGGPHADLVPKRVTVAGHTRTDGTHVPEHTTTVYVHKDEPVAHREAPIAPAPKDPYRWAPSRVSDDALAEVLRTEPANLDAYKEARRRHNVASKDAQRAPGWHGQAGYATPGAVIDGATRTRDALRPVLAQHPMTAPEDRERWGGFASPEPARE